MSNLLKEHYKELLKEEIDYSSKVATVYHLTGTKTERYDSNWARLKKKTRKEYEQEIDDKHANRKTSRARSILHKVEKSAVSKEADRYKTTKGQAYYIAKQISSSLFDSGTYFQSGGGAMYGKGLYTCYKFNPEIARTYGPVILRFDVDISNFLIFNAGIAKGIYGEENFKLQDQFLQILKRKGFDLEGFYNRTAELEVSGYSMDNLNSFIDHLTYQSEKNAFLSSNLETDDRTADIAYSTIYSFSRLFGLGKKLKLRDIIDGVIFSGNNDGPVCVIYHPESMKTYKLTGAGYFKENGQHVIESDIEALVGKKSYDLKDSFANSYETDAESAAEAAEERAQNFQNILATADDVSPKEGNLLEMIPDQANNIIDPIIKIIADTGSEVVMEKRRKATPDYDKFVQNLTSIYNFCQSIPSVLAEPFIDFVEIFGPGIEIISKDEFETYCLILKQYSMHYQKPGGYPPKLSDFESNNIKCQAQNEEEFSVLVKQHLSKIVSRLNNLKSLAEDYSAAADAINDWDEISIITKYGSFEMFDLSFNRNGDLEAAKQIMNENAKVFDNANNRLISLFSHPALQTKAAKKEIDEILKWSFISRENGINKEKLAYKYRSWSDSICMAAHIVYELSFRAPTEIGNLNQYIIDRQKFDAYFILKQYKQDSFKVKQLCDEVKNMFKQASKLGSPITVVQKDILERSVYNSKLDNMKDQLQDDLWIHSLTRHQIEI